MDAFATLTGSDSISAGVSVIDHTSGTGVEKVNLNDTSVDTNVWYDKVAQEVSSWLSGTSYDSALDALNAHIEDPGINISGLIAAYDTDQVSVGILS